MTKEELIKLSRENLRKSKQGSLCECYDEAFIKGYELSKKRIAELEHQLTHRNCLDCSNHSSKLRMRNLDLEKENAELKKKYAKECEDVSYAVTNYSKQLTKARKLLKTLIEDYISEPEVLPDGSCEDNELRNLIKEVEQFLKENKE